jgi:hypothetical protein
MLALYRDALQLRADDLHAAATRGHDVGRKLPVIGPG